MRRASDGRARPGSETGGRAPTPETSPETEEWVPVETEKPRSATVSGNRRAAAQPSSALARPPGGRARRPLPPAVREELARAVGSRQAEHVQQHLADAARAFDRERYAEARRILGPLARAAPAAPAVRELHGLTLYRLGRWAEAARELEAFRRTTGSYDQHPALADSYRALRRHKAVAGLWDELRRASPGAELVAEGRLVAAGSLADRGDLQGAIALLERAPAAPKRVQHHHLRLWYALADLYERAGDLPRARELFGRVRRHDSDFFDVAERESALG